MRGASLRRLSRPVAGEVQKAGSRQLRPDYSLALSSSVPCLLLAAVRVRCNGIHTKKAFKILRAGFSMKKLTAVATMRVTAMSGMMAHGGKQKWP